MLPSIAVLVATARLAGPVCCLPARRAALAGVRTLVRGLEIEKSHSKPQRPQRPQRTHKGESVPAIATGCTAAPILRRDAGRSGEVVRVQLEMA